MDTLRWLNLTPELSDVDVWSKLWAMHNVPLPHIRCKTCGLHQLLQNSDKEFPHARDCTEQGVHSKFPWRDLL
jgi:hypothetical protein